MTPSTRYSLAFFLLAALGSGCGPTAHIQLRQSFWKEPQHKIGVAVVAAAPLQAYREGSQGLLDLAINNAMASTLEAHLQTIDVSRFGDVADNYIAKLAERGVTAKKLSRPINLANTIPFKPKSSGEFAARDLRPIAAQEDVDELILLSIRACGTTRGYYGFIPLGPPAAMCVSGGELVDLKTNQVEWRATMERNTVPVQGEWDQPPDYPNVTRSIGVALTKAQKYLVAEFFETKAAAP